MTIVLQNPVRQRRQKVDHLLRYTVTMPATLARGLATKSVLFALPLRDHHGV